MFQIREVVLVLRIFKSGNFFLAHPVEYGNLQKSVTFVIYDAES